MKSKKIYKKRRKKTPPECYFEEIKNVEGCIGYVRTLTGEAPPCDRCQWRKERK